MLLLDDWGMAGIDSQTRADLLEIMDSVIADLRKVAGREPVRSTPAISASPLTFESARALGDVWALTET